MTDEQAFQSAIAEHPNDPGPKLVFADFLEERGECERSRNIRERIDLSKPVTLSEEQEKAVDEINKRMKRNPYVTLGGYAGTGKTSVIRHLVKHWRGVAVAALCGKAVNVLRCKGVKNAQTIHSLIYEHIPNTDPPEFARRDQLATESGRRVRKLIIDEASMVDEVMRDDLLSYNVPILFVGDHGQLEPIGRESWLMQNPDVVLNTIHRQAQDSPIIRLATALREGREVPYWESKLGDVRIVEKNRFWELLRPNMTAICAFNRTRHKINAECRKMLGRTSQYPVEGDKLVCLKNNREFQIFNGQLATCLDAKLSENGRDMTLKARLDDDRVVEMPCAPWQFGQDATEGMHRMPWLTFWDWGNALTCHRAQGSEMDDVIVLEERSPLWNMRRWAYTASTRARMTLIYCK